MPTPEGHSISEPFRPEELADCPQMPEVRKVSGIGFHLPRVHTPRRVGSQILVLRLPQFIHAPTLNSTDLEKSCDPLARKAIGGPN